MKRYTLHKVLSLPDPLEPNAIYFVKENDTEYRQVITDTEGNVMELKSVEWGSIINTPTTLTGYGLIEDADARYLRSFTEEDPVFTSSPSFNISTDDITNWDTAFDWGDHSGLYDKYQSWNLKTNGFQRTTIQSGGILDLKEGSNIDISYSAGGVVTFTNTYSPSTLTRGAGLTGGNYNGSSATTWALDQLWLNERYFDLDGDNAATGNNTFSGVSTFTGKTVYDNNIWYNTQNGLQGLYITRYGESATEHVKHYLEDIIAHQFYQNDERHARFKWTINNTDTESNGGANANTHTFEFLGDESGAYLYLDGAEVVTSDNVGEHQVEHTHTIPEVLNLQEALDGKVDNSRVLTDVPSGAVFTDTTYSNLNQLATRNYSDLQNIPNTFTPSSHTHSISDITEIAINTPLNGHILQYNTVSSKWENVAASAIGLQASDIDTLAELNDIVTDATLIDTNDSRLSDARTPLSHNHSWNDITSDKPTSILGYGITDAYTKTYIDTELGKKVDNSRVLTDVPSGAIFTDTTYNNLNQLATRNYSDLQNIPSTFTPSSHGHTWSEISGKPTYDNYVSWGVKANGGTTADIGSGDVLDFIQGSNMTITRSGNSITFSAAAGEGADGNNYLTGGNFNTSNGEITLNRLNLTDITFDIEGRYEPLITKKSAFNKNFGVVADTVLEGNWRPSWSDVTGKPSTFPPDSHTHNYDNYDSWNVQVNGLTSTSIGSGETLNFVEGGDTSIIRSGNTITISSTSSATDGNDYVDGISFNTGSGVLTLTRSGSLPDIDEDLDGRYELSFSKNSAFNKNFGGNGSASTVSRSDHNHTGVYAPVESTVNVSSSRNITASDNGKTLICSGTITLTIVTGLGSNFSCNVLSDNTGSGVITIAGSGVTLKAPHGTKLLAGYTCNIGKRTGIETFDIQGELTP
jgi:hypothetical protein